MQLTVKDLLKHDLPPTNADAEMRRSHTLGSIQHQINHFSDHGTAAAEQIKKLYTVDSKKAKTELERVLKEVQAVEAKLMKCKKAMK